MELLNPATEHRLGTTKQSTIEFVSHVLKGDWKNTYCVKLCSKPLLPVQPKFNEAPTL
jgi:hypothetical protein